MRYAREVIGNRAKENKADKIWTFPNGSTIEFGAVQYEENKTDWQGRPHDLKAFDELPEFTQSQYEFISGWNRTTDPGQRVRVLATGNPPPEGNGSWIVRRLGRSLQAESGTGGRGLDSRGWSSADVPGCDQGRGPETPAVPAV